MNKRPKLDKNMTSATFEDYYYLKEELVDFCRKNDLQTSGGKAELTERIAVFLDTGAKIYKKHPTKKTKIADKISLDTIIEENFVCSKTHREFFKEQIGNSFSFNVSFQKWLKSNAGKTYRNGVEAYHRILEDKKKKRTIIDKQFEYNTYIRDFFADNKDKNLEQAIECWKYKKSLKGSNKYEKTDLRILDQ